MTATAATTAPLDLDTQSLAAAVGALLADSAAQLGGWQSRSIYTPVNQNTLGVYRIAGTARSRGTDAAWSLVLKITLSPDGRPEAEAGAAREILAYRSGLLDTLTGVRAPRCYGIDPYSPGYAAVWLEDVGERPMGGWSLADYVTAARDLGRMAAPYLTGRPLPTYPWLETTALMGFSEQEQAAYAALPELREQHPLVRRTTPDDLFPRQLAVFRDRRLLLDVLDRLPRVLCHRDSIPRNLFVRHHPAGPDGSAAPSETIAIDWAQVGIAPIGRDLASLVPAGAHSSDVDPRRLHEVDAVAFPAYVQGLRDLGWDGDERLVRFGYCASATFRYGLMQIGPILLDDAWRAQAERSFGLPAERLIDVFAEEQRFIMDLTGEARALLPLVTPPPAG